MRFLQHMKSFAFVGDRCATSADLLEVKLGHCGCGIWKLFRKSSECGISLRVVFVCCPKCLVTVFNYGAFAVLNGVHFLIFVVAVFCLFLFRLLTSYRHFMF